jgi:flagellin-like hook-associated protein FlgL
MQVSSKQFYDTQLKSMQDLQADVSKLQQQISSGKQLTKPSDDPIVFSQTSRLQLQIDNLDQYARNITLASARVNQQSSVVGQAANIATRLQELVLQGANDTLSSTDRRSIAIEMQNLSDQLVDLGNTTDQNGEAIFGGFRAKAPVFTPDANGRVHYSGDNGVHELQVGDGVIVQAGVDGTNSFMAVRTPGESNPRSAFDIIQDAISLLKAGKSTSGSVNQVKAVVDHFSNVQTIAGSQLSRLDSQKAVNDNAALTLKATLSSLQDTNLEVAATQFSQKSLNLNASQQTFAKIANTSLFNYLK